MTTRWHKRSSRDRSVDVFLFLILIMLVARLIWANPKNPLPHEINIPWLTTTDQNHWVVLNPYELSQIPITTVASGWQMPLGSQLGAWTYIARGFREKNHLGDDLNGIGGWDSDLGDPVWAVADGLVVFTGDVGGGWGNIVILAHREKIGSNQKVIQTMYAHLDEIKVSLWQKIPRGTTIGTVGTAHGQYLAHLHLEWREGIVIAPDRGYSDQVINRKNPYEELTKRLPQLPSPPVAGQTNN